jgi:hypothetical protein
MNRKWIWIILAGLLLVGAFIILMNVRQKALDSRPFEVYDYPVGVSVVNGTDYRADTIALSLGHHILGLDSLEIFIFYLPEHINSGELYYYALVERIPFRDYSFLILLDRGLSLTELFTVLSHEFVHIEQYIRGDLQLWNNQAIWKGDTLDLSGIEYRKRPFEKEAYDRQKGMSRKLKDLLYR